MSKPTKKALEKVKFDTSSSNLECFIEANSKKLNDR